MINMKISNCRPVIHPILEIDDRISISPVGAIKIKVPFLANDDFFPSGFLLTSDQVSMYIDPVCIDKAENVNFVLITHGHSDHFSKELVESLSLNGATIICPLRVYKKLKGKVDDNLLIRILPGQIIDFCNWKIQAIPAYNEGRLLSPHPRSHGNVGYLISLEGRRILHAGDTDLTQELRNLTNIDIMMLPIGGDGLTMDGKDAADLVSRVAPEWVIPMHYDIGSFEKRVLISSIPDDITVKFMDE